MPDESPFRLETGPLSDEVKEIARKELRETPEIREEAIQELRELIKADTKIFYRDDEDFLLIYLRPCKFYAKSAYKLMIKIAEFRKTHEHLLKGLLPEHELEAFTKHNVVNVLTNRDQKGRRILIVNCGGSWDTDKVSADQMFRLFYLIHEAAILEPESQVRGVVVVMDFENMGMKQVRALSPSFSMRLLTFIQEAMPLRLKEVHMVKEPFVFNIVWNLFKPFLKEKLKKRIVFHGNNMKGFHKYIDADCLPKNYGGNLPEIDYTGADWYPVVMEYNDHIKKLNTYGFRDA